MDCDRIEAEEIAEKYVTGGLDDEEQADFELHFLTCDRCFEQVQLRQDMQAALTRRARRGDWRWLAIGAVAASMLVAAGAAWFGLRPVSGGIASRAKVTKRPALDLTALAAIAPPRYAQPQWRAAGPTAFDVAMQRYTRGDYAGATPDLLVASKADPGNSAASFFLGICYLMQNRNDEAIAQLKATIASGDSPELEESHFYLAKALLRKRDIAGAVDQLRRAVELHGPHQAEERDLLNTVTREAPPAK